LPTHYRAILGQAVDIEFELSLSQGDSMIVNSVAYRSGAKPADIELSKISDVLQEPGAFVWLGLFEPDLALLKQVQEEFSLHDLAIEDALDAFQRPKIETYSNCLFVVLNTVQFTNDEIEFGETHLFIGHNFVVSVRHGASLSYKHVRQRCEALPTQMSKGPIYVLYAIFDFVVDNFQTISEELQNRFEALESEIFNDTFDREAISNMYHLKSQLMRVRSAAQPAVEICSELIRLHEDYVPKDLRAYFRDVGDHATRVVGILDVIREMLTTAIQVNLALVTVTQNEVVKRLAGWGAVLAIPTIVFSLYGMNFVNMPELKVPFAYPLVVTITAVACVGLYIKLRRTGYL
jgi:magnesium transporter